MDLIVAGMIVIVLLIATLGGGAGTRVMPPTSAPAPSSGQDWLQIVALIFLLGILGLTLLGLLVPILSV